MRDKDDEKFMKLWEKERARGKEKYMVYRTSVLALTLMMGNAFGGTVFRGRPFHLDFFLFIAGAVGGMIGTSMAWERGEARYLNLVKEQEPEAGSHRPDGAD